MNKKYLLELQQLGVRTVPTWIFDNFKLEDLKIKKITPPFVIKPLIGGAGLNTFLINSQEQSKNCEPLLGTSVLIQPFIKSIQTVGEYSFIFFANEFSHAVLKCAKAGEFRVQDDHGGTVQDFKPNAKELQQVQDMLSKIPKAFHYARVDVVPIEGKLTLMELGVIEPELFFRFSESGLQKYCEMIQYGSH